MDRSYVHGAKSPRRMQERTASTNQWNSQTWQWDQGGQRPAKSPRKGRPKSAKGKKQADQPPQMPMAPGPPMTGAAMAPLAPMMNWGMMPMMQPSYMHMQAQPPPPPPDPAWQQQHSANLGPGPAPPQMTSVVGPNFVMPAMPKMPVVPPATADQVDSELMALLKKDVADLPPHIQKAVKDSAAKHSAIDAAQAQKNLQKAAKQLGLARKAYEDAMTARSQLYANWKKFLSDAVRLWEDYAKQFADQETKLQERVATAKETFLQAKSTSEQAHHAAGAVQEIDSDEELGEASAAPSQAAQKITETMAGLTHSLRNLQQQAAEIDTDEKPPQVKRLRTSGPKIEEVDMADNSTGGKPSQPFGEAGLM